MADVVGSSFSLSTTYGARAADAIKTMASSVDTISIRNTKGSVALLRLLAAVLTSLKNGECELHYMQSISHLLSASEVHFLTAELLGSSQLLKIMGHVLSLNPNVFKEQIIIALGILFKVCKLNEANKHYLIDHFIPEIALKVIEQAHDDDVSAVVVPLLVEALIGYDYWGGRPKPVPARIYFGQTLPTSVGDAELALHSTDQWKIQNNNHGNVPLSPSLLQASMNGTDEEEEQKQLGDEGYGLQEEQDIFIPQRMAHHILRLFQSSSTKIKRCGVRLVTMLLRRAGSTKSFNLFSTKNTDWLREFRSHLLRIVFDSASPEFQNEAAELLTTLLRKPGIGTWLSRDLTTMVLLKFSKKGRHFSELENWALAFDCDLHVHHLSSAVSNSIVQEKEAHPKKSMTPHYEHMVSISIISRKSSKDLQA